MTRGINWRSASSASRLVCVRRKKEREWPLAAMPWPPRSRGCAATRGRCSGDDGEADDLIQDTLERALARLEQWRDGDSPRKWLFSILHNLHVDGLRRKSRRPPHVGLESVGVEQSAPAADGASGRDLDRALQLLSGEQRQVVLLVGPGGPELRRDRRGARDSGRHGDVAAGARARAAARADGLRGRRQERARGAAEGQMTARAAHQRDRAARLRRRRADGRGARRDGGAAGGGAGRAGARARCPRAERGDAGALCRPARRSRCRRRCWRLLARVPRWPSALATRQGALAAAPADRARGRGWRAISRAACVGERSRPEPAFVANAIGAHTVYVPEVRHPVEVKAAEDASRALADPPRRCAGARARRWPSLGWKLMGGRLLPDQRPAGGAVHVRGRQRPPPDALHAQGDGARQHVLPLRRARRLRRVLLDRPAARLRAGRPAQPRGADGLANAVYAQLEVR